MAVMNPCPPCLSVSEPDVGSMSYRVLCRLADGSRALVRVCATRRDADVVARVWAKDHLARLKDHRQQRANDPQRPRVVFVERWSGDLFGGRWERDSDAFHFEFLDPAPHRPHVGPGKPKTHVIMGVISQSLKLREASQAAFRVVCRRADGVHVFVADASSLRKANQKAAIVARICGSTQTNCSRVVDTSLRTQEVFVARHRPQGWVRVESAQQGFTYQIALPEPTDLEQMVKLAESAEKLPTATKQPQVAGSQKGRYVEAVLLSTRTRKGGWFAKLVDGSASGPVTGPLPANVQPQPGQAMQLRLCGIRLETRFAQFAWL